MRVPRVQKAQPSSPAGAGKRKVRLLSKTENRRDRKPDTCRVRNGELFGFVECDETVSQKWALISEQFPNYRLKTCTLKCPRYSSRVKFHSRLSGRICKSTPPECFLLYFLFFFVAVVLLFYVPGKHLRSCWDGPLT